MIDTIQILDADRARRAAIARGDYMKAHEYRQVRDILIYLGAGDASSMPANKSAELSDSGIVFEIID